MQKGIVLILEKTVNGTLDSLLMTAANDVDDWVDPLHFHVPNGASFEFLYSNYVRLICSSRRRDEACETD